MNVDVASCTGVTARLACLYKPESKSWTSPSQMYNKTGMVKIENCVDYIFCELISGRGASFSAQRDSIACGIFESASFIHLGKSRQNKGSNFDQQRTVRAHLPPSQSAAKNIQLKASSTHICPQRKTWAHDSSSNTVRSEMRNFSSYYFIEKVRQYNTRSNQLPWTSFIFEKLDENPCLVAWHSWKAGAYFVSVQISRCLR